ncbi:MAG: uroporphyrinogen-III synthase [Flavobacteriales bacterium]|nr:MAG: uroporphyrinogen-III synthase [Flavobacteriales bacterium]
MKKLRILITKELEDHQKKIATKVFWDLEEASALKARALSLPAYEAPWKHLWWMITSAKAIPAFQHYNNGENIEKLACTAPAVRAKLIEAGITPKIAGFNAADIAKKISHRKPFGVIHLCAKHSREESANIFRDANIPYIKIPVYETIPENHCITWQHFDGWVVLSPRSIEAFGCSLPPKDMPVAAIGNTTMNALKDAGFTRIFVTSKPEIETLITEFNDYLRNKE